MSDKCYTQETIEAFAQSMIELGDRLEKLTDSLGKTDRVLVDIDHYLELESLSASQLSKLFKKRKELLRTRRVLKDEVMLISNFQGIAGKFKTFNKKSGEGLSEWVEKVTCKRDKRSYTCRELTLKQLLGGNNG